MSVARGLLSLLLASGALVFAASDVRAPAGVWDTFNYSPKARTVWPTAIKRQVGNVKNANKLVKNTGSVTLSGEGSWVTLDYGKEVGGLISMDFGASAVNASISLSFTESPMFISPITSDDSSYPTPNQSYDGVLTLASPLPTGHWTQPAVALRGGFRYLTLVSHSNISVALSNVSCEISFMPHFDDIGLYQGYFYAKDEGYPADHDFLTKLWYAGGYTVQTNTVPLHTGRRVPIIPSPGWANDGTLGFDGPIIVDGAKRDRAVWPGDMGIAVPTQFVTTNDLISTRNALSTMFRLIDPKTGALDESGPPLSQKGSDTYHAWTLIGTHNYYTYSGDVEWLNTVWTNYTRAVQFLVNKVDSSGLMNVTGLRDWARLGGGGHNSAGNALLYKVLTNSADLASTIAPSSNLSALYAANATALKNTFNVAFWDVDAGLYKDNTSTTLHPQDANSFSVLFNITNTQEQKVNISRGLTLNWNTLGPVAPELPDTISPFISGFEIQAHFEAGENTRAMDLIRREWGYMLYTNISVESTLLEGFTANGSLSYRSYRGYNYDAAYTSHAHGWSTGPTSALTYYILGLQVTSVSGSTWSLAPHIDGGVTDAIRSAEGGFRTPLGWFGVKWTFTGTLSEGSAALSLSVDTPVGTTGTVTLPWAGSVSVDGGVSVSSRDLVILGGKRVVHLEVRNVK